MPLRTTSRENQMLRHRAGFISLKITDGNYSEAENLESLELEIRKIFTEIVT